MSNRTFWQIAQSAVLSQKVTDGKLRIEYDGSVFPDSGMVVNGTGAWPMLKNIYFTADGAQGDWHSDLAKACEYIKPGWPVTCDGSPISSLTTQGTDPIRYGSQDPARFANPNVVLLTPSHPHFRGTEDGTAPPVTPPVKPPVQPPTQPPVQPPTQPPTNTQPPVGGTDISRTEPYPGPGKRIALDSRDYGSLGSANSFTLHLPIPANATTSENRLATVNIAEAPGQGDNVMQRGVKFIEGGVTIYERPPAVHIDIPVSVGGFARGEAQVNLVPGSAVDIVVTNHGGAHQYGDILFDYIPPDGA